MPISQTAEYALRAVTCLASDPERPMGSHRIATVARVPAGYLSKVLQKLARAGLVRSTPGRGGGFRIQRSADEITVLDVVQTVDPIRRIETCPLGLRGHGADLCPLHRRIDEAAEAICETFASTTIAELIAAEAPSRPFCES